jgi:drug/metabolite transporter, DME family
MKSRTADRFLLLTAATLFSTGGAAIKAASLTSWQVASFRSAVATVALLALVPSARRGYSARVWPVGITYASTLVFFVFATKLTTAANAIFLQSTAPLYLLLLSPLLLHERIRRSGLVFILVVGLGMVLIFLGSDTVRSTAPNPALGNRFGAASGFAWACTVTGLRWLGRHGEENSAMPAVVAGNLIACLAGLPMAFPVARVALADVAVLLYLGIFQIGLGYLCVTLAIRQVPAFEATALLLLEPALNPVWTWLVHHERPTPWSIAGGAIILAATFAHTWQQRGA